jgi:hypothetical protein
MDDPGGVSCREPIDNLLGVIQRQDNPDIYVQQIGSGSPYRRTTKPQNDFSRSARFVYRSCEFRGTAVLAAPECAGVVYPGCTPAGISFLSRIQPLRRPIQCRGDAETGSNRVIHCEAGHTSSLTPFMLKVSAIPANRSHYILLIVE